MQATVHYSEMIEHGFYQIVNLVQIFYIHMVDDHAHLLTVPKGKFKLLYNILYLNINYSFL